MKKEDRSITQFWIYIALAYGLTWVFWIPLALSGQDVMAGSLMIPLLLGGFGPSIAGIIMTYRTQDKSGRRDFWRRSINFKQISMGWYAVIFLLFPLAYGLAVLFDMLLGGIPPGADNLVQALATPAFWLVGIVMSLVLGPLSEEFGWRGYALDPLQSKWSALAASLVLGVFWLFWHTPEFFMAGIPTGEIVSGIVPFLTFAADVIAMAVLYTWVFNNTRRSILSAILLHFSHNFMLNMLIPISERADLFQSILLVMAAIIVVAIWGHKTLTRESEYAKRKLRQVQP
jgi:membrane protease YdiL (CAAX protease family)